MIKHTAERDAADVRMVIMRLHEIERHLDEIHNVKSNPILTLSGPMLRL